MLGACACTGQEGVKDLLGGRLIGDELVMFLLDPLDARALLGLRRLTQRLESLLEVLHVLTRLLEMLAKPLRKLLVSSLLLELGERLHKRLLGIQNVSELVQEQLARVAHRAGAHWISFAFLEVEGRPKRTALEPVGPLGAAGCHESKAEEQTGDEASASDDHRRPGSGLDSSLRCLGTRGGRNLRRVDAGLGGGLKLHRVLQLLDLLTDIHFLRGLRLFARCLVTGLSSHRAHLK